MQTGRLERLGLQQMLLEPEMLRAVEPDVHLVATLLSLSRVIPERTQETARQVVRKVVDELERKLAEPLRAGRRAAASRRAHPHAPTAPAEIDWHRTIRANLKHYQPERRTVVPERLVGYGRQRSVAARHRALRRSERLDGDLGRLRRHLRRGAGVAPRASRPAWSSSTPRSST